MNVAPSDGLMPVWVRFSGGYRPRTRSGPCPRGDDRFSGALARRPSERMAGLSAFALGTDRSLGSKMEIIYDLFDIKPEAVVAPARVQ